MELTTLAQGGSGYGDGAGLAKRVGVRGRKVSWALIGEAMGVSRQAAWERFS